MEKTVRNIWTRTTPYETASCSDRLWCYRADRVVPGGPARTSGHHRLPILDVAEGGLEARPAWSLELEQQIRIREDLGSFDRHFQQLSVGWSPQWGAVAETQQIVLGTRLLHRLDDSGNKQGWEQYFRWHLDHVTKVKLGRWSLASRIRYQKRSALPFGRGDDPASEEVKTAWRLKAVVSHNIKKWKLDPRASLERFIAPVPEGWPSDGAWRARFGTDLQTRQAATTQGGPAARVAGQIPAFWNGCHARRFPPVWQ